MKIRVSSGKGQLMKRVGIFFITAALIAGMVGCGADSESDADPTPTPTPPIEYNLTISSTAGGSVTTPGEGISVYDEGTSVSLVASPDIGYKFLNWTGGIETVADVTAASTTITMEADYAITANFIEVAVYLDKIGPGLWGEQAIGGGVKVTVTDEGVVVNIASDPVDDPGGIFGGGGYSKYSLEGDFDIRMGYELITWPQGSGVRVGLRVGVPDAHGKFMQVERVGWGSPESPDLTYREVYLVNFEDEIHEITSTDDLSGTLRIRREGETLIGYYGALDGWNELHRAECSAEDVDVSIAIWSHEYLFGGKEVSVLLRTVEFAEPAA